MNKKKKKNIKTKHHLYRKQRNKRKQDPRPELTYTLPNIPLAAPSAHEHALYREHQAIHELKNTLVHHAIVQLKNLKRNKKYQHAKRTIAVLGKELAAEKKKKPKNRDARKIARLERHIADAKAYTKEVLTALGFDKNSFEKHLNAQRKQQYAKIVGADAGQKVADAVWQGVEDVLYGKGERLHYEKWDDPRSISGKSLNSGINLYREDGKPAGIIYRKRFIPFKRALNAYETEALTTGVLRYVEVCPIRFSDGYHWYARFILHGKAPVKGRKLSRKRGGLDVGTSTAAFASATLTEMRVLGGEPKDYDERIAELSRRIDESMRATNPGYYNADGTIKKHKRGEDGKLVERSWKLSAHCKAMKA